MAGASVLPALATPLDRPAVLLVAALAGATVQAVAGLGLGLVAAPVLVLLAPELMPGSMLVLAAVLPLITLAEEHEDIDYSGLTWSLPTGLIGTVAGVWLVAHLAERWLALAVGLMVLLGVAASWRAVVVPINRGTLALAGVVSGLAGTTTSIGGPPMALLYQHRPPRQVRTTLAVYFVIGAVLSLAGLALGGELTEVQLVGAVLALSLLVLGGRLGGRLRDRVDGASFRTVVLVVCGTSAVVLLRAALGG